jgi:hypothetical protein
LLFLGFKSEDNHVEFPRADAFGMCSAILRVVNRFEVKHLRTIEGL